MIPGAPPGWDENPSAWHQRLPLVGVALLGFLIASYLALYQWGVIPSVWEPFFGSGSRVILHSGISRLLPIPDAALGALSYLLDAVAGLIGGRERYGAQKYGTQHPMCASQCGDTLAASEQVPSSVSWL